MIVNVGVTQVALFFVAGLVLLLLYSASLPKIDHDTKLREAGTLMFGNNPGMFDRDTLF